MRKKRECKYCKKGDKPDYKKPEDLMGFLSDRGKIIGRSKNWMCAKHQKMMSREVKRARYLAMLPYVQSIHDQ